MIYVMLPQVVHLRAQMWRRHTTDVLIPSAASGKTPSLSYFNPLAVTYFKCVLHGDEHPAVSASVRWAAHSMPSHTVTVQHVLSLLSCSQSGGVSLADIFAHW